MTVCANDCYLHDELLPECSLSIVCVCGYYIDIDIFVFLCIAVSLQAHSLYSGYILSIGRVFKCHHDFQSMGQ